MYIPITFFSNTRDSFRGYVEFLVLGGGGGGGQQVGGGGGAGGFVSSSAILAPSTAYPIYVGNGGAPATAAGSTSSSYGGYSFGINLIASGGAGGANYGLGGYNALGASGGGGGGIVTNNGTTAGGTGELPWGNNAGGGKGGDGTGPRASGGGGGANTTGSSAYKLLNGAYPGDGGRGKLWVDNNYYAGGGGGTSFAMSGIYGLGGVGGGGRGASNAFPSTNPADYSDASPGEANKGAGGGGGDDVNLPTTFPQAPAAGGSGVVKIRYVGGPQATGGSIVFDGTYTTHTFTGGAGTFTTYEFVPIYTPELPNKLFYNVTKCNETASFNIDPNIKWTPSVTVYSTGSVLYLTGSISGCFSVNSSVISASVSGSTTGVVIQNSYGTCNSCLTGYPQFPISSSLVIWNSKSGLTGSTWYDYSNNGNNGLVSGSTLTLSGSLGYSFNGTNNYVTYPSTLVGQPSSSYTLQYYGTLPSETTNRDFFVKGYYDDGWDTIYRGSDTNDFAYRGDAGFDKISPAITPTYGQKQLITIRVDTTTNLMDLYVNTTSSGDFSRIGYINEFNSGSLPLVFGWNSNGDATFWKGAVSDLLVYNKVLTPTEISQSYAYLSSL